MIHIVRYNRVSLSNQIFGRVCRHASIRSLVSFEFPSYLARGVISRLNSAPLRAMRLLVQVQVQHWRENGFAGDQALHSGKEILSFGRRTECTRGRCTVYNARAIGDVKSACRLRRRTSKFEEPAAGNIRDIKVELPSWPHALARLAFASRNSTLHRYIVIKPGTPATFREVVVVD